MAIGTQPNVHNIEDVLNSVRGVHNERFHCIGICYCQFHRRIQAI